MKTEDVEKRAIAYEDTPVSTKTEWDAGAAAKRLQAWAGVDKSGAPASAWSKYARGFTWVDGDKPGTLGAYKLPHHDVEGGRLVLNRRGLFAAAAAVRGARGGVSIPSSDMPRVRSHLASHFKKLGMTAPWMRKDAGDAYQHLFIAALDGGVDYFQFDVSPMTEGFHSTRATRKHFDGETIKSFLLPSSDGATGTVETGINGDIDILADGEEEKVFKFVAEGAPLSLFHLKADEGDPNTWTLYACGPEGTDGAGVADKVTKLVGDMTHRVIKMVPSDMFHGHMESDGEEHYVMGEVLVPEEVDSQGDVYSEEEVRKAAHLFMEEYRAIGVMHRQETIYVKILETFLSPTDMVIRGRAVKKGTWLLAARVLDADLWRDMKEGRITGWSIGGSAVRTET